MEKFDCKICGYSAKSNMSLMTHVNAKHPGINSKKYYDLYLKSPEEGICKKDGCNNETFFEGIGKGYRKFCSIKCSRNDENRVKQQAETCQRLYGGSTPMSSKKIQNKAKETNIERYGGVAPACSKEVRDKMKETTLERHGVKNPMQNKEIKEKQIQSLYENYGVTNPLQSKEIHDRTKTTNLERYGFENPGQVPEFKKIISEKVYKFNKNIVIVRLKENNIEFINDDDFINVCSVNRYKFKCTLCGNVFEDHLDDGRNPRCLNCFPYNNFGTSKGETELYNFCSKYFQNIIRNDRTILEHPTDKRKNKELDIYIPEINLAIEFNGCYFHSEEFGKDKYYHLNKTKECKSKGIHLIHIFDDEWLFQREKIESILLREMGKSPNIINVNDCIFSEIGIEEAIEFAEKNNLLGYPVIENVSSTDYGLFYKNELVCSLSFVGDYIVRITFKNYYEIEHIKEYFNKFKQFNFFVDNRFERIDSYVDCGFSIEKELPPKEYNFGEFQIWDCGQTIVCV